MMNDIKQKDGRLKSTFIKVILVALILIGCLTFWPFWIEKFFGRKTLSHLLPLFDSHLREIGLDPFAWEKEQQSSSSKTRYYDWTIRRSLIAPDGVLREMMLVNDAFPGPTIEANVGDQIIIKVKNDLFIKDDSNYPERQRYSTMIDKVHNQKDDNHISLHWHGLQMRLNPDQDGAHGFTSCSIPTGMTYTYNFTIGKEDVGTHWWHSHVGMSRSDGLWGGFIIRDKEENEMISINQNQPYEAEQIVMFGDHYHQPGSYQLSWFMSLSSLGFEPTPESGLINGKNVFNCQRSIAPDTFCNPFIAKYSQIKLGTRDQKTRLRLINVGAVGNQFVSIDHHSLTVIEADGELIQPFTVKRLPIAPGQRYSVIVNELSEAKDHDSFWLRTTLDRTCFNMGNPALDWTSKAIVTYSNSRNPKDKVFGNSGLDLRSRGMSMDEIRSKWESFILRKPFKLPNTTAWPSDEDEENGIFLDGCQDVHHSALKRLPAYNDPAPSHFDQRIILSAQMPRLSKNKLVPMGYINSSSWRSDEQNPILNKYLSDKIDENPITNGQMVIELPSIESSSKESERAQIVEVVVQNFDDSPHPFHLHGHSFWVMETFMTKYLQGPYRDKGQSESYDFEKAIKRDTINIPRRGYSVIRFKANNPGVWAFHCHVLVHMVSGMAMAFVDQPNQIQNLQIQNQICQP